MYKKHDQHISTILCDNFPQVQYFDFSAIGSQNILSALSTFWKLEQVAIAFRVYRTVLERFSRILQSSQLRQKKIVMRDCWGQLFKQPMFNKTAF